MSTTEANKPSNPPMPAIMHESLVPLAEAAKLVPPRRSGKPAHASTMFRWAAGGLKGVKLEVVQVGGTKRTSREALLRFFSKLTLAERSGHE